MKKEDASLMLKLHDIELDDDVVLPEDCEEEGAGGSSCCSSSCSQQLQSPQDACFKICVFSIS